MPERPDRQPNELGRVLFQSLWIKGYPLRVLDREGDH